MITAYAAKGGRLVEGTSPDDPGVVWIDLMTPSREEELALEHSLGLELPTRDEMEEIEQSSRLYAEDGALFMTALVPANSETDSPVMAPVTFVLAAGKLITIRYHAPKAIELFAQRLTRGTLPCGSAEDASLSLIEVMIDRLADILERVGRDVEGLSRGVFAKDGAKARRGSGWRAVLEEIGRKGDLVSNIRDSLGTLERMAVFFGQRLREDADTKALRTRLKDAETDIRGLSDHSSFMSQKVSFLMDATLGLIGIEQNGIIKIFSVASVVFLPPTLIASIYGMNFDIMPELTYVFGYPLALIGMLLSAVLPYLLFKRKGWL